MECRRGIHRCAGLLLAAAALAAPARSCPDDPRRADLSPWVGEWRLVAADGGRALGTTRVRPILGGCAFEEVRERVDGSAERALVFFDAVAGQWRERWVSSRGETGAFALAVDGDRLRVTGDVHGPDGSVTQLRAELAPGAAGGFEERLEISADGGVSWQPPQRTLYLPPGAVQPAAPAPREPPRGEPAQVEPAGETPAAVEPAPRTTAPTSGVIVRSDRLEAAPVVESVAMVSPMTLEFELGPLDKLPPDTGWTTEELAPYVADEVHVVQVVAQRRQRRRGSGIELTLHLRTTALQRKVDVEAVLLSGDAPVASASAEGITLGKLIASHHPRTGRPYALSVPLDDAAFASLFAGDRRPTVRLTVTVR